MDYLLQITNQHIALGISGVAVLSTFILTIIANVNKKISKKADKEATEREFNNVHHRINEKADRSVVNNMAEQIDKIYNHLMK